MSRVIRLIGTSLTKYGKKRKSIIELPITKALSGITTKNNKQYLLIGDGGYYVERVIVFNPITEQIETDFTSSLVDYWWDIRPLTFSNNGSFVLMNGVYWKYDTSTKTYQVINLNISNIHYTKWLEDSFIVFTDDSIRKYDLNGNLLNSISVSYPTIYYVLSCVDMGNKVLIYSYNWNVFYVFDISTFQLTSYNVPFTIQSFYGFAIYPIKDTNKLHMYDLDSNKLYQFDLDTQQMTLVRDFSNEDFIVRGYYDVFYSNDGKIVFLAYFNPWAVWTTETYAYNTETNEIRRLPIGHLPMKIQEHKDSRIFLIIDAEKSIYPFVYDYNNDKLLGIICNFPQSLLYSDGEILLMV
jgi:hypothetical protein